MVTAMRRERPDKPAVLVTESGPAMANNYLIKVALRGVVGEQNVSFRGYAGFLYLVGLDSVTSARGWRPGLAEEFPFDSAVTATVPHFHRHVAEIPLRIRFSNSDRCRPEEVGTATHTGRSQ